MTNLVLNLLTHACAERLAEAVVRSVVAVRGGMVVQADGIGLFLGLLNEYPLLFTTDHSFDNEGDQAYLAGIIGAKLAGLRVVALAKEPADRVIRLVCSGDSGDGLTLHYEAIPKRIDLILTDADAHILARLRQGRADDCEYRPPDPPAAGLDLFTSPVESILEAARTAADADVLTRALRGGDPSFVADLLSRLRTAPEQALTALTLVRAGAYGLAIDTPAEGTPLLLPDLIAPAAGATRENFDDPPRAAQIWYRGILADHERAELSQAISHALSRQRKRLAGTLRKLEQDLAAAGRHERHSQDGDLILANIHRIRRGQDAVTVQDYYDPDGGERVISLDPLLDPAANAEAYYTKARRSRRGIGQIQERMSTMRRELADVDSLVTRLDTMTSDIRSLRSLQKELVARRWITQAQKKKLKVQRKPGNRYESSDGLEIIVGRSSAENEIVTFQVGRDNDFWMHAAGSPGSHVVIRNPQKRDEPPANTLEQAAALAAWYSKARNNANVQVHWTIRRHVKKLKGGSPGQVLLGVYQSILVKPAIPAAVRFIE